MPLSMFIFLTQPKLAFPGVELQQNKRMWLYSADWPSNLHDVTDFKDMLFHLESVHIRHAFQLASHTSRELWGCCKDQLWECWCECTPEKNMRDRQSKSWLEFLKKIVIYLYFQCTVVGEDTWNNFSPLEFVVVCFMARMWPVLKNVPCPLEKNVYSAFGRWKTIYMCGFIYSINIYKTYIYMHIALSSSFKVEV